MRLVRRYPFTTLYLTLLALTEAPLIAALVLPYNSARADWLITALLLAPMAAGIALLLIAVPIRVIDDVIAAVRRMGRN